MTKRTLKNLTRRPVSFASNTGRFRHLPPGYVLVVDEIDVRDNLTVQKLVQRGVLATFDPEPEDTRHGAPDAKPEGRGEP